MTNNNFKIIEYKSEFKSSIIKALIELQAHEHDLSDTRKAPSIQVCEEYFLVLLKNIEAQDGKIFICLQDNVFAGLPFTSILRIAFRLSIFIISFAVKTGANCFSKYSASSAPILKLQIEPTFPKTASLMF